MVEVRSVGPASPAPAAASAAASRHFYAQAGAFADEGNARRLADRLVSAGFSDVAIVEANSGGRDVHRVRIGPLDTVPAFDAVVARLNAAGFGEAILALD
jgi:rare lipoprotein A